MLKHPTTEPQPERAPVKKRGSYNCGRCGLPKKGHVCTRMDPTASPAASADLTTPSSTTAAPAPLPPRSDNRLRRALSFVDDGEVHEGTPAAGPTEDGDVDGDGDVGIGGGSLPGSCLAQILKRLGPKELMGAAAVCRGWRDLVRRVWISAEEVRLKVGPTSRIGFVGSVLNKCTGLTKLTLTMQRSSL